MRRASGVLLTCVALIALAVPAGAAAGKKAPDEFFGVVTQEPLNGPDYARLAEGEVGTLRVTFNWATAQQVPGQCQPEPQVDLCSWYVFDEIVARAAFAGTRVMPVLAGPPDFVSKNPQNPPTKGQDKTRWRAYLSSLAKRYGRGGTFWDAYQEYGGKPLPITDWQIWNEQNGKQGWDGKPNAKRYGRLVKISAQALRNGDREADIVLGGMFGNAKVPLTTYMRQLYRVKGIERFFDAIALHPYAPRISSLRRQLASARSAARAGGDLKVNMRITEIGWSSAKGHHELMQGAAGQAKMLKKSFKLLQRGRRRWNLEGVNWFALQDTDNHSTCRFCIASGLLKKDGKAKPSWRAFKKFSK